MKCILQINIIYHLIELLRCSVNFNSKDKNIKSDIHMTLQKDHKQ